MFNQWVYDDSGTNGEPMRDSTIYMLYEHK